MSDLGQRIVAQARTYRGVPFFHTGRSREGVDCIGLLACVAHDLGITDYDDLDYAADAPAERLTETLSRFAAQVLIFDPERPEAKVVLLRPGDVLQFMIAGDPRHCGIFARSDASTGGPPGWPSLIHAYQSAGCVVEHAFDSHWQRRLWAAYRLREG